MTTATGAVAIPDRVSLYGDRKALCRLLDTELVDIARQQSQPSKLDMAVLRTQARQALITSGFRKHEASAAVDAAIAHVGVDATLEQLLVEAFRRCKPQ